MSLWPKTFENRRLWVTIVKSLLLLSGWHSIKTEQIVCILRIYFLKGHHIMVRFFSVLGCLTDLFLCFYLILYLFRVTLRILFFSKGTQRSTVYYWPWAWCMCICLCISNMYECGYVWVNGYVYVHLCGISKLTTEVFLYRYPLYSLRESLSIESRSHTCG